MRSYRTWFIPQLNLCVYPYVSNHNLVSFVGAPMSILIVSNSIFDEQNSMIKKNYLDKAVTIIKT